LERDLDLAIDASFWRLDRNKDTIIFTKMVSQGIKLNHKFCVNDDAKKLFASLHKQLKEKHKRPHMRLEDF
jgi:hypothetical protein